jgi:LysM repeat protein
MQRFNRWGIRALLVVLSFVLVVPATFAAPANKEMATPEIPPQEATYHEVVWGDTLLTLALRYGTTVNELVRLNDIANPNLIYVGQNLLIHPGGGGGTNPTATPAPSGGDIIHLVQPGDTIYGLAGHYGVTAQSIIDANNIINPNLIYVGDRLVIPGTASGGPTPLPPTLEPTPDASATPGASSTPVPEEPTSTPLPEEPTSTPVPEEPTSTPVPQPTSDMGWGIQGHFLNQDMAQIVQGANDMNLQWLKQQIRWNDFEPEPGTILWGPIDNLVNGAQDKKLLFSVLAAPDWARPAGTETDPNTVGPPGDPNTYAAFVGDLAGRYCGKVGAIEVWNEQNLAREWGGEELSAARYMDLLKAAYTAIKEACPATVVVSGALTPTGAPQPAAIDDFIYLADMYQNGLADYSDAIGVHPSGYNIPAELYETEACAYIQEINANFTGPCDTPHHSWTFRSTMEGTRSIMVANSDSNKKLWVTEFGWGVASGSAPSGYEYTLDNSREEQAVWTSQAYSMGRDYGYVGAMFLWNLNFAFVAPGSEQSLWSVFDESFNATMTVYGVRDIPR